MSRPDCQFWKVKETAAHISPNPASERCQGGDFCSCSAIKQARLAVLAALKLSGLCFRLSVNVFVGWSHCGATIAYTVCCLPRWLLALHLCQFWGGSDCVMNVCWTLTREKGIMSTTSSKMAPTSISQWYSDPLICTQSILEHPFGLTKISPRSSYNCQLSFGTAQSHTVRGGLQGLTSHQSHPV